MEREIVRGFRASEIPVAFVRSSQERGLLRTVSPHVVDEMLEARPKQPPVLLRYFSGVPAHATGRWLERNFRRGRRRLIRALAPSAARTVMPTGTKDDWFLHVGNNWRVFDCLDRCGFAGHLAFLVFDIIPLTHATMFDSRFARYMLEVARRADIVFTISNYSRDTIIREFPQLRGRVSIVPLGFDHLGTARRPAACGQGAAGHAAAGDEGGEPGGNSSGPPADYLLSVGKLNARKNQAFLFDVLDRFRATHGDPPSLVLAGSPVAEVYPEYLRYKLEQRPWLKRKLVLLDKVDDAALEQLYAGCRAFLFPSLIEGWGMPITEAIAAGKPVLAMAQGSAEEAGLGFAHLLHNDAGAWSDALARVLETPLPLPQECEMRRAVAALRWETTVRMIASTLGAVPARSPSQTIEAVHPLEAFAPNVVSPQ
ncbi:MAG: glycosyltransferase [Azospirillaceae bacterium]